MARWRAQWEPRDPGEGQWDREGLTGSQVVGGPGRGLRVVSGVLLVSWGGGPQGITGLAWSWGRVFSRIPEGSMLSF